MNFFLKPGIFNIHLLIMAINHINCTFHSDQSGAGGLRLSCLAANVLTNCNQSRQETPVTNLYPSIVSAGSAFVEDWKSGRLIIIGCTAAILIIVGAFFLFCCYQNNLLKLCRLWSLIKMLVMLPVVSQ